MSDLPRMGQIRLKYDLNKSTFNLSHSGANLVKFLVTSAIPSGMGVGIEEEKGRIIDIRFVASANRMSSQ